MPQLPSNRGFVRVPKFIHIGRCELFAPLRRAPLFQVIGELVVGALAMQRFDGVETPN